jgi:sugar transferase (PEP-CTERM/EpsH1 system associated)
VADLLYLVHRMPYPPNKGDKVRSYHLLKHLVSQHRVFLGTFIDDPADEPYIDTLRALCAGLHVARLDPRSAKLRSLRGLLQGDALTLGYYRDAGLSQWVARTLGANDIRTAVVFSSSMAQYVEHVPDLRVLIDFVDVDSAKWTDYAKARHWPASWLYQREGATLLAYERAVAATVHRSFFVTDKEVELFNRLAPECAEHVQAMGNGVDTTFFATDPERINPFDADEIPIVFTGAMDYWPNADAVTWFAQEVLPTLRSQWPAVRFSVVGRSPSPEVRALAGDAVRVTGTVPDVRPWLQHAAVVVAPLRLARGVQNKVLEAMAMSCPVVAATRCAETIDAEVGVHLVAASTAADYVREINGLLSERDRATALGCAARSRVVTRYGWTAQLSTLDAHLSPTLAPEVQLS